MKWRYTPIKYFHCTECHCFAIGPAHVQSKLCAACKAENRKFERRHNYLIYGDPHFARSRICKIYLNLKYIRKHLGGPSGYLRTVDGIGFKNG